MFTGTRENISEGDNLENFRPVSGDTGRKLSRCRIGWLRHSDEEMSLWIDNSVQERQML